ncbi:MAG: M14 family metallopeptidase [Leeuwenhoekiella sp.]
MKYLFLLSALLILACAEKPKPEDFDLETIFEKSNGTQTATYDEIVKFYEDLDEAYVSIKTYKWGKTDSGEPLTLVTYNPNRTFDSEFSRDNSATRVLINNGIHPGEPDGIDATMLLMRDLASGAVEIPENVWVSAIAVYNIGGALNRNSSSRTNQNGPEAYGFRGNARNYDLNRDFIKADTDNAQSFAELFHRIDPDIFVDNHVSNGADYQYTLTHLFTQHDKLGGVLGEYLHREMQPQLENYLTKKDWDITPYVNVFNKVPEEGFSQFMDHPRYSTGYTSLFNTLGLMVETHMLKPYKPRVEGTYQLMLGLLDIAAKDGEKIKELRAKTRLSYTNGNRIGTEYPIAYSTDSTTTTTLDFKGYAGEMKPSTVTGGERLKYDRNQPFTKPVTYYNYLKTTETITIPKAYVVPKAWREVVKRLNENDIDMTRFGKDTVIAVEKYRIVDYSTRNSAYEGHYLHYDTQVTSKIDSVKVNAGDWLVPTAQSGMRYLLETLEPSASDSFFNWNYFDTILQQKEGFSPYVWEDKAAELLKSNAELQKKFQQEKEEDSRFAKNWYAQLDWLHKESPNYEAAHLSYPILRIFD